MIHTIWTNDLNYEDWREDLEAQYPDEEGYNDDERTRLMYEINDDYLDDEKYNLNKELYQPIIMFGSLGLWDGVRTGFKFLNGTNLNDCLGETVGEYVTWYVEDGELKCSDTHHDGTNHYIYRVLKNGFTKNDFLDYLDDHKTMDAIKLMTKPLGNMISEIYGWEKFNESV